MAKTQNELAFLRDLAVDGEWTQRFADLVDKHLDLTGSENLLYINAGTGGHALAICEKFGEKTNIFVLAGRKNIGLFTKFFIDSERVAARAGVDVEQIFRIGEVDMLINKICKSSRPLAIYGHVTQKREFVLGFRHAIN